MKRTIPLTKRQSQILDFLAWHIQVFGYAPTFEEIATEFCFSSMATVHQHLVAIETKGYIKRRFNEVRSIDILKRKTV